ncbi:MAG: hypothetical protein PHU24_10090 [Sphaerochaetaceae bacterium]|nr:hypothetical protein [Sphaerochaetaceae bacterium]MDD4260336.1 hypothetical protein [Sphaerochaetaceae bacterium]
MHLRKTWCLVLMCSLMVLPVHTITAEMSTFIGVFTDYAVIDDTTTLDQQVSVGAQASIDVRTLLGSSAYLGLSSYARFSYNPISSEWMDYVSVMADGALFVDPGEIRLSIGSDLSYDSSDPSSVLFRPMWDATFSMDRGYRTIHPFFTYYGYVDDSAMYNGIQLGMQHTPIVECDYSLAALAGITTYTDAIDKDIAAGLRFSINGLAGYVLSWNVNATTTYTWSSDPSKEGVGGAISLNIRITPTKIFQLLIGPHLDWTFLTSTGSWHTDAQITVRSDVAITEDLYWYVESSAAAGLQYISGAIPWTVHITTGVDFSL